MRRLLRALPLVALPLLAGCSLYPGNTDEPEVCTAVFATHPVLVTDAAGAPVIDAAVDVFRVSTGQSIFCTSDAQRGCVHRRTWSMDGRDGRYVVMDDGVAMSRGGEDFRVVATRGASKAEALLRFRHDGCHVEKLAGPNTLVLAP